MANQNFVVQNGLTVGPLTIDATTGSITTTGTITSTSTAAEVFSNLTVNSTLIAGTINAGTIGNAGAVLSGTLNSSSASQPNITTLAGLTGFGASGVTTTAAGNFTITGCLTVNGTTTTVNNTTVETTEFVQTIDATTVRAATIGNTGATLTGTLSTAAQTNVTSLGTLTGLTVSGTIAAGTNNTINIGAAGTTFATVYATTFSGVSTTAKYADLAENYQGDKSYAPGTVVMFGGSSEVTVADADTTAVAGVVSTNPAHLMNGGLSGANVVAVAFTGRVPCSVIGPVKKGDLMVSAGFGYAKASANPGVGQVIGKALQEVTFAGKAVIEVVVGRF
jgi:hypothetical protein